MYLVRGSKREEVTEGSWKLLLRAVSPRSEAFNFYRDITSLDVTCASHQLPGPGRVAAGATVLKLTKDDTQEYSGRVVRDSSDIITSDVRRTHPLRHSIALPRPLLLSQSVAVYIAP